MHVDRVLEAATTGEEVGRGLVGLEGFEDETAESEARETASVNLGKQKRQDKKLSGYLFLFIILHCSTSIYRY